jgi:hypothetical protein
MLISILEVPSPPSLIPINDADLPSTTGMRDRYPRAATKRSRVISEGAPSRSGGPQ